MLEELRPFLYYPLGFLPSIFFTTRLLLQWFQSEQRQESYVGRTFWRLSLCGNLLLLLHYIIQVQFPFALLQAGNGLIAWRNLSLMRQGKALTPRQMFFTLTATLGTITLIFLAQSTFFIGELDWIRTPTKLWDTARHHHHIAWHILGAIGGALFASRFWIQWWQAEHTQKSQLSRTFWWLSITGSLLSLTYFIRIQDIVSVVHYGFGIIPYARNLLLMRPINRRSMENSMPQHDH